MDQNIQDKIDAFVAGAEFEASQSGTRANTSYYLSVRTKEATRRYTPKVLREVEWGAGFLRFNTATALFEFRGGSGGSTWNPSCLNTMFISQCSSEDMLVMLDLREHPYVD